LAALLLVLLRVAARLATQLWTAVRDATPGSTAPMMRVVVVLWAAVLALAMPMGTLPVLPGPATLLVMAALCVAVLRAQVPLPRAVQVLAPLAAALCLLAAVERMRAWPG
jgi:hypothetical protein